MKSAECGLLSSRAFHDKLSDDSYVFYSNSFPICSSSKKNQIKLFYNLEANRSTKDLALLGFHIS